MHSVRTRLLAALALVPRLFCRRPSPPRPSPVTPRRPPRTTCAKGSEHACGESRSVLPSRGTVPRQEAVTDQDLSALRGLGLLPDEAEPQRRPDPPAEPRPRRRHRRLSAA